MTMSCKHFACYEDAEKHWSSVEKLRYRAVTPALSHRSNAMDFIMDLQQFTITTGDPRFQAAIDALYEHRIANEYQWIEQTPFKPLNNIEEQFELTAAALVQSLLQKKYSLRLAAATCAANLRWPGNSFSAAVKAVERIWRASQFHNP